MNTPVQNVGAASSGLIPQHDTIGPTKLVFSVTLPWVIATLISHVLLHL